MTDTSSPNKSNPKIALIGGGGVRTPLLIYGIQESAHLLNPGELVLYDPDAARVRIMAELGRAIVAREGGNLNIRIASSAEDAVAGASFVLNSIRVGGIDSRALDERTAIEHGYPGQETTGPGGVAMALRTVPAALAYARLVEQYSPDAWLINFTNPAGLITQAIAHSTQARVVGICDTPDELFHRIATALKRFSGSGALRVSRPQSSRLGCSASCSTERMSPTPFWPTTSPSRSSTPAASSTLSCCAGSLSCQPNISTSTIREVALLPINAPSARPGAKRSAAST